MLKEIFVIEATNDDAGNGIKFYPTMIMGKEEFDTYPSLQMIENMIDKHKGNAASVKKEYRKL